MKLIKNKFINYFKYFFQLLINNIYKNKDLKNLNYFTEIIHNISMGFTS